MSKLKRRYRAICKEISIKTKVVSGNAKEFYEDYMEKIWYS